MARKVAEFKCLDCGEMFARSEAIQKLEQVKSANTNKLVFTDVYGCINCPSRNLKIESMGEVDAKEQ